MPFLTLQFFSCLFIILYGPFIIPDDNMGIGAEDFFLQVLMEPAHYR